MKTKIFVIALFAISFISAQEKKEQSYEGGCCLPAGGTQEGGGENIAMADMQDHSQHKYEQNKKDTTVKKDDQKAKIEYVCPMHPEVKSSSPGRCPKCKMDLVEVKKEKKSLMKQKMQAMKDGKYNCCLQEPCDECLKAHGACDCKKAVKNDKPVCNECYEGWQHGKGDVSGKSAKDIKKGHQHNH